MTDFLFDTPYWLLGILVIAGIALWMAGNNRQEKRLMMSGCAAIGLAILLVLLSYAVDTDKEKVSKRTREIVAAVVEKDVPKVRDLLHPLANCLVLDKDEIADAVARASDDYRLKNARITSMELKAQPDAITVTISVIVDAESSGIGGAMPSNWQLVWIKSGKDWLLRDILPLPGRMDLSGVVGRWNRK